MAKQLKVEASCKQGREVGVKIDDYELLLSSTKIYKKKADEQQMFSDVNWREKKYFTQLHGI